MIKTIKCDLEGCNRNAEAYSITVPNPNYKHCNKCGQPIGEKTKTLYFCSPRHTYQWLKKYLEIGKHLISRRKQ